MNMKPIISTKAHAKINLALKITGKLLDGYHSLDMVTVPINIFDTVSLFLTDKPNSVEFCGRCFGGTDNVKNNILPILDSFFKSGAHARIVRDIPAAAGLGGSSAACGAIIRALHSLYPNKFSHDEIYAMAIRAGADVPFFVSGGWARVTGKGETVATFTPASELYFIVAVSGAVLTRECFEAYDSQVKIPAYKGDCHSLAQALIAGDLRTAANYVYNDLTPAAVSLCPGVLDSLSALSGVGALATGMTGSGSACFAMFATREHRDAAYNRLDQQKILFIKAETNTIVN